VFNFHCTFWVWVWESNHPFVISCLLLVAGSVTNLDTMAESVVQYYHWICRQVLHESYSSCLV
jgi:hypothetical protein